MRVIAGKYRGRPLLSPEGDAVRPTTDKVKESIFGSIQFEISDSVFVDLFAGSGAIGIEALSRGARHVVFVDNSRASIDIVRANLAKVKVDEEDSYELMNSDYEMALSRMRGKADIIFVDAPYKDKPLAKILSIVQERDLLADDGKIIYEHLYEDGQSDVGNDYEVSKMKKYGTVCVEVIRRR